MRVVAPLLLLVALTGPAPATATALRGAEELSTIYASILDADFEGAARAIAACREAPPEACELLEAVGMWWRLLLDPDDTTLDPTFSAAIERAIVSAEAWTARAPDDAEAWFYLGGAYGARAQWRVLRRERLAAARDGARIKRALERALTLDPDLDDAHFGIGMYQYYAAVAPAAARVLRMMLLLPGGNRAEGLARMLRARDSGVLTRSEADYQLHVIYLWYERDFDRALALLEELAARHPRNPLFPQLVAEVYDTYFHDRAESRDRWVALLERARRNEVHEAALARNRARLGLAHQLDALFDTDLAISHWQTIIDDTSVTHPYGARAEAFVRIADAHARLGDRARADAAYRQAIAAAPVDDPAGVRTRAREGLSGRGAPTTSAANAYRLSLEAWRAFERGDVRRAADGLARAVALAPDDRAIRYRHARVLSALGDPAAREALEHVALAGPGDAPTFFARAVLDLARLHEALDEIDHALGWYTSAATTFGAERATIRAAREAIARLTDNNRRK